MQSGTARSWSQCGCRLPVLWSAVGIDQRQRSTGLEAGIILMQSTGQGATQSSQPVHSRAMTVCICLGAPTMASTGQA